MMPYCMSHTVSVIPGKMHSMILELNFQGQRGSSPLKNHLNLTEFGCTGLDEYQENV